MHIKKLISIFCIIFLSAILSVQIQANVSHMQGEKLATVVTDCFKEYQSQKGIDLAYVINKVQKEAANLNLNLQFDCIQEDICTGKEYNLLGVNKLTGSKICDIIVNQKDNRASSISVCLDPNNDGCIKNAEDGNLYVAQSLEEVFVKSGNEVRIGQNSDLRYGDKNVYKIIQKPSLMQELSGPCGYYALYNLLRAYRGQLAEKILLYRQDFNLFYDNIRAYNSYDLVVSNLAMKDIIENKVQELCKKNVMISIEEINKLNNLSDEKVITFGGGFPIDRVKDFQKNGTPQYIIAGTSSKRSIPGLQLQWNNIDDRLYGIENHWIAMKIEWADKNKPGNCPVYITVFDSGGPKDNRFTAMVHWYYQVFVHSDC